MSTFAAAPALASYDRADTQSSAADVQPFDKSTVPLLRTAPNSASAKDRRIFSNFRQDEGDLLPCDWDYLNFEQARSEVAGGATQELVAGSNRGALLGSGLAKLLSPVTTIYYGKLDTHDLWVSKYWGGGIYTGLVQHMPRALTDTSLLDGPPTPLDHEEMRADFRNPKYVLIMYRGQPEKKGGLQSIAYLVNTDFVKFKEMRVATRRYCVEWANSEAFKVVGWKRYCENGGAYHAGGIRNSGVSNEKETMLLIGFACG